MQRVLLLFALAVGVVVMHHVPSPAGAHAMAGHLAAVEMPSGTTASGTMPGGTMAAPPVAEPAPGLASDPGMPAGEHSMLHLCLAVLLAAGTLVVSLFAVGRYSDVAAGPDGARGSPSGDRPPDRRGRTVLTSLCVMRT